MPIAIQIGIASFACLAIIMGSLMLFAPARYPNLYKGFLNERVMQRETSDHGRILATRVQGLIRVAIGAFCWLFFWALR
jgi:hypothetical protein